MTLYFLQSLSFPASLADALLACHAIFRDEPKESRNHAIFRDEPKKRLRERLSYSLPGTILSTIVARTIRMHVTLGSEQLGSFETFRIFHLEENKPENNDT